MNKTQIFRDSTEVEFKKNDDCFTWVAGISAMVGSIGGLIWVLRTAAVFEAKGCSNVEPTLVLAPIIASSAAVIALATMGYSHFFKYFTSYKSGKFQNTMNLNSMSTPMIFPEIEEFDFDSIIGDKSYQTICGHPVEIDKIVRDITKTTVLGVSGTITVRGIKIRGIWDCYGNIIECRRMLRLCAPSNMFASIDNIFNGTTDSMFRLVSVKQL